MSGWFAYWPSMNRNSILSRLMLAGLAGLVLFAPDDGGGSGGDGGAPPAGGDGADDGDGGGDGQDDKPVAVNMTQAELEQLLNKRVGQARKGWDKEIADAAEAAGKSDEQRLRDEAAADKEAADRRAAETDRKLIRAAAIPAAIAAGVRAERANALIGLADLSDVEVGDNDEPDAKALEAAIAKAVKDYPEFKVGSGGSGASGAEHDGGAGGSADEITAEQFAKLTYKERVKIQMESPELYARLSAA